MYSKKKRKKQRKNKKELNKGDLFYADLGAKFGSEQNGIRPVIIVQNDIGNKHGNTVIIVPLTSIIKGKLKQPTHSFICPIDNLKRYSIALAEQITTIDKMRLREKIGHLRNYQIEELNNALKIALNLKG